MQKAHDWLLSFIPEKFHAVSSQFLRYLVVAFVGLGFDFGTMIFLREVVGIYYLWAAVGGFIAGLTVNYILSNKFVFSDPKIKSQTVQFGLFAIIGLVGLGLLSGFMWFFTSVIGIHYIVSKVLATVFVYIWNFGARRMLYHA